ncbi:6531_t:CDS:2, partial [Scutellospora calospora]
DEPKTIAMSSTIMSDPNKENLETSSILVDSNPILVENNPSISVKVK